MDLTRFVEDMAVQDKVTRRRVLELAAMAGAGGVLLRGASPAVARAREGLSAESVRIALAGDGAMAAGGWSTSRVLRAPRRVSLAGVAWDAGARPRAAELRARRGGARA